MKTKFRFKNEEAQKSFISQCSSNEHIAQVLGTNDFYGLIDKDGDMIDVSAEIDSPDLVPDYFPIFFKCEVRDYITQVEDTKEQPVAETDTKYDALMAENADLRSRLAKLEIRVNRIERLV